MEQSPTYHGQWAVAVISLACKGPVLVRSIFKVLQQAPVAHMKPDALGTDCIGNRLEDGGSQPSTAKAATAV